MVRRFAIIFDLDGTLVDTETIHAKAESKLLSDLGIIMTPEEITHKYAGIHTESYIEEITNHKKPLNELMSRKNRIIDKAINEMGMRPILGMPELVDYVSGLDVPIFVASSSDSEWIRKCLSASFEINNRVYSYGYYFKNNFISCSEVHNHKPSPDVFLEAKKRMKKQHAFLNNDDIEWIVVGDSLVDMEGALKAKMKAFIWGNFKKSLNKNTNVAIFSTSEKLAEHVKITVKNNK